jgi:hypothetical protein
MTDPCWLPFGALDDRDLVALASDPSPLPIPVDDQAGVVDLLRGLRDHARILADALPDGPAAALGEFEP